MEEEEVVDDDQDCDKFPSFGFLLSLSLSLSLLQQIKRKKKGGENNGF